MDEIAAWTREQAEADVARARMAGVFVSDPRTEAARAEAVLMVLAEFEAAVCRYEAERADYSAWVTGTAPVLRPHFSGPDPKLIPGLGRAVRLLAWGYRHREGWRAEWTP